MRDATPLHPEAHAVSAFRVLPDGTGRQYTATWFPDRPWGGIEWMLRQARAFGYAKAADHDGYAVLDILNENTDIVQDFSIPTAAAFRWWYRKLDLRVDE